MASGLFRVIRDVFLPVFGHEPGMFLCLPATYFYRVGGTCNPTRDLFLPSSRPLIREL